jgi:hypothetical protein
VAYGDIARRVNSYPQTISERYRTQDRLLRFLDGTLYDDAKLTPFDREFSGPGATGEYVELKDRRPSVVSNFARQFVEQTIGLLWMDEQFPIVRCFSAADPTEEDSEAEKIVQHLIEAISADEIMARATYLGSIGSAAIVVRGLPAAQHSPEGEPWYEVWRGYQCVPIFNERNPRVLEALPIMYSLTGEELKHAGYGVAKDDATATFWLRIDLDARREVRYKPMRQDRFEQLGQEVNGQIVRWEPDSEYPHRFGVTPAVWGRSPNAGNHELDGPCIFGPAIDTIVEIDYALSQIGRAYYYTADPILALRGGVLNVNQYAPEGSKTVPTADELTDGTANRAARKHQINVPAGGDAKLLEIEGSGLNNALEYVTRLREYALESIGGMKSDSETQKGAQSGKALELLYQALVIVVKRLRLAWGNRVLIPMLDLTLRGIQTGELVIPGVTPIDPNAIVMRLKWPQWMTPTGADFLSTVMGWQALAGGSAQDPVPILDRPTVTRLAATNLGFQDSEALVQAVEDQTAKDSAADLAQQEAQLTLQSQHAQPSGQGDKA